MKSELRLTEHKVLPGEHTVEVWHDGRLVCTVVGADGPGVRVISRYDLMGTIRNDRPLRVLHALVILPEN